MKITNFKSVSKLDSESKCWIATVDVETRSWMRKKTEVRRVATVVELSQGGDFWHSPIWVFESWCIDDNYICPDVVNHLADMYLAREEFNQNEWGEKAREVLPACGCAERTPYSHPYKCEKHRNIPTAYTVQKKD